MGGSRLTVLRQWEYCDRCDRSRTRLDVFAPQWPPGVKVVVFFAAATRASQAVLCDEPARLSLVEEITLALGLTAGECVSDALVACGLGVTPTPDEVAACSARFALQPSPAVVVLFGAETQRLAAQAGLLDNGTWHPYGAATPSRLVHADSIAEAVRNVARELGCAPAAVRPEDRTQIKEVSGDLMDMLGYASGIRIMRTPGNWGSYPNERLTLRRIRQHLAGSCWVAPFKPRGPWPYVVIDIDRHNAIQEARFDDTVAQVRALFPHALLLQSSDSLGVHAYVSLPPEVGYDEAALIVEAFLVQHGLRSIDAGADRKVRSLRTEVPRHPVRLPFGRGSRILGDERPLYEQFRAFQAHFARRQSDDFAAARAFVERECKLRGNWSLAKMRKLETFLQEAEVRELPDAVFASDDPCANVAPKLPVALRKVLRHGVPAYGTRTRWTVALIEALAQHVPPEEVTEIVGYWTRERRHISEDLESRPLETWKQTEALITRHYRRGAGGVPERLWRRVEGHVRDTYALAQSPSGRSRLRAGPNGPLRAPPSFSVEQLLDTAFFILRRFYRERRNELRLHHETYFAKYVGKNNAHCAEVLLTHLEPDHFHWLVHVPEHDEHKHPVNRKELRRSRKYCLHRDMWPPRPHERLLFARP